GQVLAGLALQQASVALVEPMLSASLLFALAFAAAWSRLRLRWQEIVGAVLLTAALAVFIGVGDPHDSPAPDTDPIAITIGVAAIVGAVLGLVAIARPRSLVGESVLL